MSALITASAVAGATFGVSALITLTLIKLIPTKAEKAERDRVNKRNELIERLLLRSAIAYDASAAALDRIAVQLETNGHETVKSATALIADIERQKRHCQVITGERESELTP